MKQQEESFRYTTLHFSRNYQQPWSEQNHRPGGLPRLILFLVLVLVLVLALALGLGSGSWLLGLGSWPWPWRWPWPGPCPHSASYHHHHYHRHEKPNPQPSQPTTNHATTHDRPPPWVLMVGGVWVVGGDGWVADATTHLNHLKFRLLLLDYLQPSMQISEPV